MAETTYLVSGFHSPTQTAFTERKQVKELRTTQTLKTNAMVRVYFEKGTQATLAAVFVEEYTYNDVREKLERLCKDLGFERMTESIEHSVATDRILKEIENL